jgi:hypothetical protein
MSLVQLLIEDHSFFRNRFQQIRTLGSLSEINKNTSLLLALTNEFRKRHKIHLRRETELLIPSLKEAYRKQGIKPTNPFLLFHLEEEHVSVGRNMYLLEQELTASSISKACVPLLQKVILSYIPHMEKEERDLFPEAERLIPLKQLEKMAHIPVSEDDELLRFC